MQRGISRAEVLSAIWQGTVIESDLERQPFPSFLLMRLEPLPLHVVVVSDVAATTCFVITVYRPDLEHFEPGFARRRR